MEGRDQLSKQGFMQGTRQKWALLFVVCAFIVMAVTVTVAGFDPVPFMQFFLAIGSIFIAGASGDSWVKAYKVGSLRETEIKEETKRIVEIKRDDSLPDTVVINQFRDQYAADPSYAPLQWAVSQEPETEFR